MSLFSQQNLTVGISREHDSFISDIDFRNGMDHGLHSRLSTGGEHQNTKLEYILTETQNLTKERLNTQTQNKLTHQKLII
jgi:hypothetical protein